MFAGNTYNYIKSPGLTRRPRNKQKIQPSPSESRRLRHPERAGGAPPRPLGFFLVPRGSLCRGQEVTEVSVPKNQRPEEAVVISETNTCTPDKGMTHHFPAPAPPPRTATAGNLQSAKRGRRSKHLIYDPIGKPPEPEPTPGHSTSQPPDLLGCNSSPTCRQIAA